MAKLIDDTVMLDLIADEIVAGRAEHPTGAMRRLGVPDGSAEERRLLRKWAASTDLLMTWAEGRHRERKHAEALRRAESKGFGAGYKIGVQHGREQEAWHRRREEFDVAVERLATPERRPSWLSRLFTWAV